MFSPFVHFVPFIRCLPKFPSRSYPAARHLLAVHYRAILSRALMRTTLKIVPAPDRERCCRVLLLPHPKRARKTPAAQTTSRAGRRFPRHSLSKHRAILLDHGPTGVDATSCRPLGSASTEGVAVYSSPAVFWRLPRGWRPTFRLAVPTAATRAIPENPV